MQRIWKRTLAVLLAAILLVGTAPAAGLAGIADWLSVTAAAETVCGQCGAERDNVTWEFDTATGTLTISGMGAIKDYGIVNHWGDTDAPWRNYRSVLQTVVINSGVTEIGTYSFYGYSALKSMTIADSVRRIGSNAFGDCVSLVTVTIPDGVTSIESSAFYGCTSLVGINIPDSVAEIGNNALYQTALYNDVNNWTDGALYVGHALISTQTTLSGEYSIASGTFCTAVSAFSGCKDLTGIVIPAGMKHIGIPICDNLESFASVTVDPENRYYSCVDGILFDGEKKNLLLYPCGKSDASYRVPDGVTAIGDHAFRDNDYLIEVSVPDSVKDIGVSAFSDCHFITEMKIPNGVTCIRNYTFASCRRLVNITIPDSVTSIGDGAFKFCDRLARVTIPDTVTRIGEDAFRECDLTELTIPGSVTNVGAYAFAGCTMLENAVIGNSVKRLDVHAFESCEALRYVTLGNQIESIGDYAFSYCDLQEITVPDSVTEIGEHAFDHNRRMSSVRFGSRLETIGEGAFEGCEKLLEVTIPDSVTHIKDGAFVSCTSLSNVVIGKGVVHIGGSAFGSCTGLTHVTVPASVTDLDDAAFIGCSSICSYTVENENPAYSSDENGVLYNKDKSCLILYPLGETRTEFTVPESVESLGEFAFYRCTNLTNLIIENRETYLDFPYACCLGVKNISISDTNNPDLANCRARCVNGFVDGCLVYADAEKTELAGCGGGYEGALTVPDSVLSIDAYAFEGCMNITDVYIPDSVTVIGESAFINSGITSVRISNSVTAIEDNAFKNCTNLRNLTIPDNVTAIRYMGFNGCSALESVDFGAGVKEIGHYAFEGCVSLKEITIPDTVEKLGAGVFWYCTGLELATIGSGMIFSDWGYLDLPNTFGYCTSLKEFRTTDNNPLISSDADGVLYSKTYDMLIAYPTGAERTSYSISDSVKTINAAAFQYSRLTSVTIGKNVEEIGEDAFWECKSLSEIRIPDSVTMIGRCAFYGCSALKDVYYHGDKADWNKITIESYNVSLKNADLHFAQHKHKSASPVIENNTVTDCNVGGTYERVVYCKSCGEEISRETVSVAPGEHSFDNWTFDPENMDSGYTHVCTICGFSASWKPKQPTEVVLENQQDGVVIEGNADAFDEGTTLRTMHISLSDQSENFVLELFSVQLIKDGVEVQPKEPIILKLAFPAWFKNTGNLSLWHFTPPYGWILMNTWIEGNYICCVTDSLSPFAFTEGNKEPEHMPAEAVRENETAATCTAGGSYDEVTYCDHCGIELFREHLSTDALGHDFGAWTEDGDNHTRTCTRCPETETAAHVWGDAVVTSATCQAEGSTVYTCTVCGTVRTETIPQTTHHPAADVKENETPATCTEAGKYDEVVYCKDCGTEISRRSVDAPALGHSFTQYVYNNDATTEKDGTKTAKCDRCDATDTIPAPGTKIVPTVAIRNYVESKTVDYRTTITFTAVVENTVAGGQVQWFVDGQSAGTGETLTVTEAKKTFTVQAKYVTNGSSVESEIETVKVNAGFFARLKAFFRGLFKKLPVIVQEYLGVEIIDRVP